MPNFSYFRLDNSISKYKFGIMASYRERLVLQFAREETRMPPTSVVLLRRNAGKRIYSPDRANQESLFFHKRGDEKLRCHASWWKESSESCSEMSSLVMLGPGKRTRQNGVDSVSMLVSLQRGSGARNEIACMWLHAARKKCLHEGGKRERHRHV